MQKIRLMRFEAEREREGGSGLKKRVGLKWANW